LDSGSILDLALDGPEAGSIRANSVDLGGARLDFTYEGTGAASLFTLVDANANPGGSTVHGLPEGAWVLAGDPASEFRITYAGGNGSDVLLERTGLFVPPELSIRVSGTGRVVEWPLSAQGYTLQYSPDIAPPVWSNEGLPLPDATATEFFVIDGGEEVSRFYRLIR
jgi:hypothetical protein